MKTFKRNLEIPTEMLANVCHRYSVAELALFGSVLRDDFTPESDVDILVTFIPEAKIGLIAFNQLQEELTQLLQRQVDLVPKKGIKPLIKDTVL